LNLNFLIKKKHIFKRRRYKTYIHNITNDITNGIYSRNQFKFEFVYLKTFKRFFKRKKRKKRKKIEKKLKKRKKRKKKKKKKRKKRKKRKKTFFLTL